MKSVLDRFMEKVAPEPNSGCWLWTGAYHRQGYGSFFIRPKILLAHRVSWTLHKCRDLLPQDVVCHSCDVPSCVNPDHLWLGDQRANMNDAARKGRLGNSSQPGSRNARAILNENMVAAIRSDQRVARLIAAEYGVAATTIYAIKNGVNWRAA